MVPGFWIPIVSLIPESTSCLPDSKATDSGFRKKFPGFRNLDSPTQGRNRPFPSSPGPLFQSEGRCSAFDMEIMFHSQANKTHFHKKGCAPSLILKVRVFGTRKWHTSFILHEMPLFPSLTSLRCERNICFYPH